MNSAGSSPVDAPPAYDFAQEFDQKLALASNESMYASSSKGKGEDGITDSRHGRAEAVEWTAMRGHELGPVVKPLAFKKKHNRLHSDMPPIKERPRWLEEMQQQNASSSNPRRRSLPQPNGQQRAHDDSSIRHVLPEEDEEDRSIPPPPFAITDNSLDGPAYERYASDGCRRRSRDVRLAMHYGGEGPLVSPPSSPLASPHIQQRDRINSQTQTPVHRSRSPAARTYKHQQSYVPPAPRMHFDPAVAYDSTQSLYCQYGDEPANIAGGAAALYSPAVAPHLSSSKPSSSLTVPKMNKYNSSIDLSNYDHRRRSPSPYASQDFAASRVSVYSQASSVTSNAPSVHHQYPSMYPAHHGHPRTGQQYLTR